MAIPSDLQGKWTLTIPAIGNRASDRVSFTLTADEFHTAAAQKSPAHYTGVSSSSGSYKGGQISFQFIAPKNPVLTTTYVLTVLDDEGTKMHGPLPPEGIKAGAIYASAQLANKTITQAEYDEIIQTLDAAVITATKGGGSMETMLMVVLGLAVVWMLMNYKK